MNFCAWDYQDDYHFPPIPCDKPASVKIQGMWFCEEHADEAEDCTRCGRDEEANLDNMEDL
jgi:hypothetical protein